MKPVTPLLLATILLTGCSTHVWYRAGVNRYDTSRDEAACKIFAESQVNPASVMNGWWWLADQGHKDELFKNCMIAKGYVWTKEKDIPKTYKLGQQNSQPLAPASSSTHPDATN